MNRAAAHEPRIARVAPMIADQARSLMLAYLPSGEFTSAGASDARFSSTVRLSSPTLRRNGQDRPLFPRWSETFRVAMNDSN
jgi:hypothetical protein